MKEVIQIEEHKLAREEGEDYDEDEPTVGGWAKHQRPVAEQLGWREPGKLPTIDEAALGLESIFLELVTENFVLDQLSYLLSGHFVLPF